MLNPLGIAQSKLPEPFWDLKIKTGSGDLLALLISWNCTLESLRLSQELVTPITLLQTPQRQE